eukprot:COSAG06_NODE_72547_length_169_cov_22.700000_1_plen_44_part_01
MLFSFLIHKSLSLTTEFGSGGKWINGWGSYLFEGQKYEYADNMK